MGSAGIGTTSDSTSKVQAPPLSDGAAQAQKALHPRTVRDVTHSMLRCGCCGQRQDTCAGAGGPTSPWLSGPYGSAGSSSESGPARIDRQSWHPQPRVGIWILSRCKVSMRSVRRVLLIAALPHGFRQNGHVAVATRLASPWLCKCASPWRMGRCEARHSAWNMWRTCWQVGHAMAVAGSTAKLHAKQIACSESRVPSLVPMPPCGSGAGWPA